MNPCVPTVRHPPRAHSFTFPHIMTGWKNAKRTVKYAFVVATVPVVWTLFIPWQARLAPLQRLVETCRTSPDVATAAACPSTWFDAVATISAEGTDPAGALAARNWVHTLYLAATVWFAFVCVPRAPVALMARWVILAGALLVQPGILTRSVERARAEPPFTSDLRALFPAAYADAPELALPLDPPTAVALFLAGAIVRMHPGVAAWIICVAQATLAMVYAIVLRRVPTPSLVLTALAAWTLTQSIAPHTKNDDNDESEDSSDEDDLAHINAVYTIDDMDPVAYSDGSERGATKDTRDARDEAFNAL